MITEGLGDWSDELLAAQSTQIVGHLGLAVGAGEVMADQRSQVLAPEAVAHPTEVAERAKQGDHARMAKAEAWDRLVLGPRGKDQGFEAGDGAGGTVRLAFELEQPAINRPPHGDELAQVQQASANTELMGFLKSGLSAKDAVVRPVLLDGRVAMTHVQREFHSRAEDPGSKDSSATTQAATTKQDLELLRAS